MYIIRTPLVLSRATAEYRCFHLEALLFFFPPDFPLNLLHFPPNSAFWYLRVGAGAGTGDTVTARAAVASAETPAGQSGGRTQNCLVIHGLVFKSFGSLQGSKESKKSARCPSCLGRQLSAVLLAPHRDLKLDVGQRKAVVFWVVLPSLAWRKGTANACFPAGLERRKWPG